MYYYSDPQFELSEYTYLGACFGGDGEFMAIKSLLLFIVSLSSSWIVLVLGGIIEGRPPIKGSNFTYRDCLANAWAASFPEPCWDKKSKLEGSAERNNYIEMK